MLHFPFPSFFISLFLYLSSFKLLFGIDIPLPFRASQATVLNVDESVETVLQSDSKDLMAKSPFRHSTFCLETAMLSQVIVTNLEHLINLIQITGATF